jgi:hypothetical protein
MAGLPKDLEQNPAHSSIVPDLNGKLVGAPATVLNPEREIRFLGLQEAMALALENGTLGTPQTGQSSDTLPTIPGGVRGQLGGLDVDGIRILALVPALLATDVESALSKFDARWITSINWNTSDRPVGTALESFQALGRGGNVLNAISQQDAQFRTGLVKPLPTGGVAGITFSNDYQFTNLPARVNPSYRPTVQFAFEQPLLQGFGIEINQLTAAHPGGILQGNQFNNRPANAAEGILLTRIRLDQARAEFERAVQGMLLNVEIAYWNLYAAYGQLYAREIALRYNLDVWRVTKDRVEAGVANYTQAELMEAQGQYEQSRSDWLAAMGAVLERERNLRGLLGMPAEDGTRLVPADSPTLAPYHPNWETSLQEALTLRPELVIARDQLKATQFHVMELRNRLLPDLRFTATYEITGIGNRLDGNGSLDPLAFQSDNALRSLASNHFNNWGLGLRLDWPLGFRDAHAGVRAARLRLAQSYWALRLDEDKVQRNLAREYRNIIENQQHIEMLRRAVDAYNTELIVRRLAARAGKDIEVDVALQSIRLGTAALVQYYDFIARYNTALASFEWGKGTYLQHNNIVIADGPLPGCAHVRAVEHERRRNAALVLRERALPPQSCDGPGVEFPKSDVVALPELIKSKPALPQEVYQGPLSTGSMPARPAGSPKPGDAPPSGISVGTTPATIPLPDATTPPLPAIPAPPGLLSNPGHVPQGSTGARSIPVPPPVDLPLPPVLPEPGASKKK